MNLILEFDDFSPHLESNCINELDYLIDKFPNIKINLFTSPAYKNVKLYDYPEWCDRVRVFIENNNIKLALHGVYHTTEEFKFKTKIEAVNSIIEGMSIFKYSNLDVLNVFRGPHWGINSDTYDALIELGFTHVYTHDDYKILSEKYDDKIKNVYYNWNLKDEFINKNDDIIIAHGHTHNVCNNGIQESMSRIVKFIEDYSPNFLFVDEI